MHFNQYGLSETQHGDFVKSDWCPELTKIQSAACWPYTATEVQVSRSNAGHLTPDVILFPSGQIPPHKNLVCSYIIIRDFGVDWRHVKPTVMNEPLFQAQRAIFEVKKSLLFRIIGYNDCVGP